jgi:hypothetical protein
MPEDWASGERPMFEVDYGCNSWLVRKQWLWALVHEPVPGFSTGEDIQLSYAVKKYYAISTWVVRLYNQDAKMGARSKSQELRGTMHTGTAQHNIRFDMYSQLIGRGAVLLAKPKSIDSLVLSWTIEDAKFLVSSIRANKRRFGATAMVYDSHEDSFDRTAEQLCEDTRCHFDICQYYGGCVHIGKFNMAFRGDSDSPGVASDYSGYFQASFSGILEYTEPKRLVLRDTNHMASTLAIQIAKAKNIECAVI